jgi:hypothetical protein
MGIGRTQESLSLTLVAPCPKVLDNPPDRTDQSVASNVTLKTRRASCDLASRARMSTSTVCANRSPHAERDYERWHH